MLFYDWEKIFEASEGNPHTMYIIFRMMYLKEIPDNRYDKLYKYSTKNFTVVDFSVRKNNGTKMTPMAKLRDIKVALNPGSIVSNAILDR